MNNMNELQWEEMVNTFSSSESSNSDTGETDDTDYEYNLVRSFKITRIEKFIEITVPKYTDRVFQTHFRISRHIIYHFIDRLQQSGLIPIHEFGKEKITSEKALLLTVWYLSNTETFRQVSDRFDISLSSAHRCLHRVLNFFLNLRTEYIKWPTVDDYRSISAGFTTKQGIGGIVGAIDGCHVKIRRPRQHNEVYCNRHKYFSVLIQGIVDHRKRFLDVYCGEPGSIHDARLLRKSSIYTKAQENVNFFGEYFLLGDSAYPSLRWLVPPFKDNGALTPNHRVFNFKHSSCRIVVEHTFGLLKGRFRRLHCVDNINIVTTVKIIMVSCILHNICQIYKDDTPIEPYNIEDQIDNTPEAWADFIVCDNRREEIFRRMFQR